MKNNKYLISSFVLGILFVLFTISLIFVDVRLIGETNAKIGLGFINEISSKINYNSTLDKISDIFLALGIIGVLFFGIVGVIQLIKRKSLKKVDREIIVFGIFLIIMVMLWITFDKFLVINYRPILIDGEIEASYPSTHVMIVTFTLLTVTNLLSKYIKNDKVVKMFYGLAILFIMLATIFRILSGMHWISDCVGGLLLGSMLYSFYIQFKTSTFSR